MFHSFIIHLSANGCHVLAIANRLVSRLFLIPSSGHQLVVPDDAVKVLHSICQQIWKTQQQPQDWKRSVFIPIPKKGNAKECSNYCTISLISRASKVMLKILQARLQQYVWTVNFLMFKLVLEKAEEPEIKLPTSAGSWKKQESSRKTSIFALLTMPKQDVQWPINIA